MKEKETDGKLVRARTGVLIGIFAVILLAFCYVLYDTQYVHGQDYRDKAAYSVAQTETVDAARGEIIDRYGRPLISNETVYQITLDASLSASAADWYATLHQLLTLCRAQRVEWTDTLPISAEAPFVYTLDTASSGAISRLRSLTAALELNIWSFSTEWADSRSHWERAPQTGLGVHFYGTNDGSVLSASTWTPTMAADELLAVLRRQYKVDEYLPGLTDEEARALVGVLYELDLRKREITYTAYTFASDVEISFITLVKEHQLLGVTVETASTRRYDTDCAAHILGRVSAITAEQWQGSGDTVGYRDMEGYSYNDLVGQEGVEKAFEHYLHGTSGTRIIETSSTGKIVSESWITEPDPGDNVSLTIDLRLQEAVEAALADHIESLEKSSGGAVVVVDMTGGVLAMASYPTYDLSSYSASFSQLAADPLTPLVNRATQGTYMPGSIFKMVTALAGLEEGVIEPNTQIRDTGYFTGYTSSVALAPKCWIYRQYHTTHGLQTVSQAIQNSCNVFFYEVGYRIGIDTLGQYASLMGLGQSTGIEIPERTGYVAGPATSELLGTDWYAGATTAASIGQENNLFTPLQLANYIATLVNGGTRYQVHLLNSVLSSDYSEVVYQYEPVVLGQIDIEEENLAAIKQGMYLVTQTSSIAQYFNALPVKAGAKTGTAQVNNNTSTNATFVCFAPYDDPQIAICLVVEEGSSGSSLASLAAEILQFYFSNEESLSSSDTENTLTR